ncbi:MAG: hypothetical protein F6K11_30445 [Leptolyngbya sp. SIO3F4]|nr:hypothetical protein [Leptolyngbya sp. SIO3F4]
MQCTTTTSSVSDVLTSKLNSVLSTYPAYPYQVALGNGAIKQLLLDYVECKLKQAMPILNASNQWQRLPHHLNQLVDLELRLESYIYWGIEYIIQNQLDLLLSTEEIAEPSWDIQDMNRACMTSHWFG